jgi:hypothetical protein
MLKQRRHHVPRPESAERPRPSIGAMPFARQVAGQFAKLETGYRDGRCNFAGNALISYRKFLSDPDGYKELLSQDNIASLRETPELKRTSRVVLYYLTDAQNEAERNTAGKYARIVDYLHKEGVDNADAADYVRSAGGIEAILKKARGREALQSADATRQDDDRDFDQEEEPDDADDSASSGAATDDLFDPAADISVRVGSETLELVLSPGIPVNEVFYLECWKTGSIGRSGIRIEGRLYDAESE